MKNLLALLGALTLVAVVAGAAGLVLFLKRGVSARAEPWAMEAWVARELRHLAVPYEERTRENPLVPTDAVVAAGRAHFADHCAACHGNDGRGQTAFGKGLYPPPPDMRGPATQGLSDGELFWIIRNGVRFTGMPAFGEGPPEEDEETWPLVQFIRHLPEQTPEEVEQMKALNPVSREELEEQARIERFLAGEEEAPAEPARGHKH